MFEWGDASHGCRPFLDAIGGYPSPHDCHCFKTFVHCDIVWKNIST
jgi:hypothetical protein